MLSDQAVRYMALAGEADGAGVLASSDGGSNDRAVALGRELLRVVFGRQQVGVARPEDLAELAARPEDTDATGALWCRVTGIFEADPEVESAVADMLTGFFRLEFGAGHAQALVELGDLLRYQDKHEEARDAYRRAADAGNSYALISLAGQLARGLGDFDGAGAVYREAIDTGDPDVAAEALFELGHLLARRFAHNAAAQAAFRQAIAAGHPRWAPNAKIGLGHILEQQGDLDGACGIYRQMIDDDSLEWAAHAAVVLGEILQAHGDAVGAEAVYWRAVDSGAGKWTAHALVNLLNVLEREGDLEGARTAHLRAVQTGNTDAPYGLIVIGHLLQDGGDAEGARAAFEQARAAGVDELLIPDGF